MKTKVMQLDLFDSPRARETKFGQCFLLSGHMYMRVKPINFMLNSTLVQDVLGRGDVFVVRLDNGRLSAMSGDTIVTQLEDAEIHYREKH